MAANKNETLDRARVLRDGFCFECLQPSGRASKHRLKDYEVSKQRENARNPCGSCCSRLKRGGLRRNLPLAEWYAWESRDKVSRGWFTRLMDSGFGQFSMVNAMKFDPVSGSSFVLRKPRLSSRIFGEHLFRSFSRQGRLFRIINISIVFHRIFRNIVFIENKGGRGTQRIKAFDLSFAPDPRDHSVP